ncbi:MAG: von Willebrand factor type A domain-containing protein [Ferruginibacter sp.]
MKKLILMIVPVFLIALSFNLNYQQTVTGMVSDEKGNPILFATVSMKYGKAVVQTDKSGHYSITVPDKNTILLFSAIGFESKQVKPGSRTVVNVILKASNTSLKEVIISAPLQTKTTFANNGTMNYVMAGKVSGVLVTSEGYSSSFYSTSKDEEYNTEGYDNIAENIFLKATDNPLSTFSIDVDGASYSNIRRILNSNQLPPAGAVRVEEMVNYFHYDYPQPTNEDPFSFTTEISECPWNSSHRLALIGMQGRNIPVNNLPPSNLVFLIDVSGSMEEENKLPLVKSSLKLLTDQLREQDKVSIVVYAGAAGMVLAPTSGSIKTKIKDAIDQLSAGGSTAGGEGIMLAYKTANANFNKEGNNRVILCTDGDFNIGMSSDDEMERLIEKERNTGVFLTVLGYGMGNYKDSKMQKLADKGNGNHAYIDGISEAKKVLVNEFGGTLFTIAKDVKLQVEFNPAKVQGYRLIGYENRMLKKEDFNDDTKDAGELGSGHTVTALYEIIPVGIKSDLLKDVDKLKYQNKETALSNTSFDKEIMTIKFRFKTAKDPVSKLTEHAVYDDHVAIENTSANFRFAAAVAAFGMLLRNSEFKGSATYDQVLLIGKNAIATDKEGYRNEFMKLVAQAKSLSGTAAMNTGH